MKILISSLLLLSLVASAPAAFSKPKPTTKAKAVAASNPPAVKKMHPLDPLTHDEVTMAMDILKKEGKFGPDSLLPYLVLKEPPKSEVLAHMPGKFFRREAFAVVYDRKKNALYEITINLRGGKIVSAFEAEGMQPPVMLSEFDAVPPIVKADERFKAAMARRGITNLDDVVVDTWAFGSPDADTKNPARMVRAVAYFKGAKGTNFYARPIEGFTAIVNMSERKVDQVIDSEVFPIPPQEADLDETSIAKQTGGLRPPRKPLIATQPEGVDFKVTGNEVEWQNWRFRFAMHPREGLVLYHVQYKDKEKWRPVLYRASLSEMMVPYGHNDQHWTWRAAFDEGEYGIGRYSGSLERGTDVPANAKMFDALFVDDFGKPYVTKDAMAIWEKDGGLLWKHYDMFSKKNVSRRGRDLVVGFITTISNYDYGLNWIFKEDGSLELEVVLSGIMLAKGSTMTKMGDGGHDHHGSPDAQFAHLVAPNVVAPHHQHFFNVRLDLDIDGVNNSVSEINAAAVEKRAENPAGNAFAMTETPLLKETQAARDMNFASQRKWKVYNNHSRTPELNYPRGFILLPGDNALHFLQPKSPLLKRGGFIGHHVWFTQANEDELYAAGPYPTQRKTSGGLPEWIKQDRSLDNKDIVLWYSFAMTHAPRPEEWPVMPVHKTGFKLIPAGFFDRSPALDVRK